MPAEAGTVDRDLRMMSSDKAQTEVQEQRSEQQLTGVLDDWTDIQDYKFERMMCVLEVVQEYELLSYGDISQKSGVYWSTPAYIQEELATAVQKTDDGIYQLTEVGYDGLNRVTGTKLDNQSLGYVSAYVGAYV